MQDYTAKEESVAVHWHLRLPSWTGHARGCQAKVKKRHIRRKGGQVGSWTMFGRDFPVTRKKQSSSRSVACRTTAHRNLRREWFTCTGCRGIRVGFRVLNSNRSRKGTPSFRMEEQRFCTSESHSINGVQRMPLLLDVCWTRWLIP